MQPSTESSSSTTNSTSAVDAKITADLNVLKEKMELCHHMLSPGDGSPAPSLKNNETMLTVVGFLEACAPRMVELVEAGAQGNAFSESVLMECLAVNDSLQKMLADIDTLAETETAASTTAASAPKPSVEEQMDDLLLDDSAPEKAAQVAGGKTTGEDDQFGSGLLAPSTAEETKPAAATADPFGNDLLAPTPAAAAETKPAASADPFANEDLTATAPAPAAAETTTTTDDFDSFLAERTTK
jgi:hypothetical protein